MSALSLDLRKRIVAAFDRGGRKQKEVAELFSVSAGTVNRPSTDKASWMLAGLRNSGNLPEISCGSLSRLYREDIYMAAVAAGA